MDRRKFMENSGKAILASAIIPSAILGGEKLQEISDSGKTKVVLVGTGKRGSRTWGKNLLKDLGEFVEMVGLCDINPKRAETAKKFINTNAKVYIASDFDRMIKETKPDYVIVTTTDSFHVDYIVRAMELGVNVISEKPIATEAEQCQRITDAEKRTGKKVTIGFNMRFMSGSMEMKKIIDSGVLGKILSVDFHEYLDTTHGSSYFRRWHGKTKYSGSLLVHKASHHFDLVNWLLEAEPVEVQAMGKVAFYGHNHSFRSKNCRNCRFTDKCDFYWDITKSKFDMDFYVKNENVDGYYRDGCVWDNENDSLDTGTVQVTYDNGAFLTYTLNANLPYEGQKISFTGEKGRLDLRFAHRQPWEVEKPVEVRLSTDTKTSKHYFMDYGKGDHGGADEKEKALIFNPNINDSLGQIAGSRAGILSSLIGIAARESIKTGKTVKIDDLISFNTTWRG